MIQSFKANASIPSERVVVFVDNTNTVAVGTTCATAASYMPLGVSIDAVSTHGSVPLKTAGEIARVAFNDTITAGNYFVSDANGKGIPWPGLVVTGTTSWVCGIALETVVSTGSVIDVYFQPSIGKTV